MSLYEFSACVDGFNRANGEEQELEPLSRDDYYDMVRRLGQ